MSETNGAPPVQVNVQQSQGVVITLADIYEKLIVVETKLAPILDPEVGVMAR